MAYVVTSPCIPLKDLSCINVCPVNCFFDAGQMLIIHPEECIDCGLCVPECPVQAIHPLEEVSDREQAFIELNKAFFTGAPAAKVTALFGEAGKALASVDDPAKRQRAEAFLANPAQFEKKKTPEEMEKLRQTP
jgi:NAD-dependent dihydropyrimidine dehydrogenase PreA subunit